MKRRTSPTRTASGPASWPKNTPSWGAGRRNPTPAASSRVWASPPIYHYELMMQHGRRLKVKVLLAQALFGKPDIHPAGRAHQPSGHQAIEWLEDFLLDFEGTVIVVSHDRHFLNTVCTHIVDIDYGKIKMYVGNYDFWYESSPADAAARQGSEQARRTEDSGGCRRSSHGSPPTSPRASRPPPAGSSGSWTT